jgi:general secretion pathway protein F
MTAFHWKAVDQRGQVIRGKMDAPDEAAVIEHLQRQGHVPLRADPAGKGRRLSDLLAADLFRRRGPSKAEVAGLIRELGIMLGAGQDIDRALRFLVDTAANRRVAAIARDLRDKVRGGSSLAAAMAAHPDCFPQLYIGLVRAGEAAGTLADNLQRLGQLLERERALVANVQSALLYPAILVVAAIASIALLLIYVLPQFVPFFAQSGAQLPWSTRMLIALGGITARLGPWLIVLIAVASLAGRRLLADQSRRLRADRLLLRLPVFGALLRETLAARFTRALGTLLTNGVPLIATLTVVERTLGNLAAQAAVETATAKVKTGAGLATSLEDQAIFPARTIHLLRLGEETAQLGVLSLRAADIHEELVRLGVQRIVTLLVPTITIVMGAAVAAIVASLLSAMLSLNDLVM